MLHFAPERVLRERLARIRDVMYVGVDLSPISDVQTDITALPFKSGEFECVICSHVLEHVEDDRAALREIRRVMRPGGMALIVVPMHPTRPTHEDPTVTSPQERLRLFGQSDHVRAYGTDVHARVEQAGFRAETFACDELLGPGAYARLALGPERSLTIYHAK